MLEITKKETMTTYEINKSEDTWDEGEGPQVAKGQDPFAVITFRNNEFNGCQYRLKTPYSKDDWDVLGDLYLMVKKLCFEHELPGLVEKCEKKFKCKKTNKKGECK